MTASPRVICMHDADNVAIVVNAGGLAAGTTLPGGLVLVEGVPQGHKVALQALPDGSEVRRYNVIIGHTKADIPAGGWVNEQRLRMPEACSLDDLPAPNPPADLPPLDEDFWFDGYRNPDGSVGTRNLLAISTTVQCVAGVLDVAVRRIKADLLPQYPHVDGVVALEHTYGCGVAIDAPDAIVPIRTLRNLASNPNFGGEVMVVSLGCEKLQPERLFPLGSIPIHQSQTAALDVVCLQDDEHIGFASMIDHIVEQARTHLERLNQRRRERCHVRELVVGVQCGGSDAFSGVTANPAVGFATDLLVRAGASVMFSENTEVRDAVDQLTTRAANAELAQRIVHELGWYDAYLARGQADRSANTTPGNKKGGLSNIVEKAMGSVVKSGTGPIHGVIAPGEKLTQKGLIFAATPASDFICGTLQLAAGMNLHVFTTGRGTPYGLAACPVIKVATRTDLARRWHDLMDLNAGQIADGEMSIEEAGWTLFRQMLEVASGKRTWSEQWGIENALVLFNPAPVT
ncbi:galactarate dehydratase [Hydrogenophaga sp. 5NK40-0174]|uniref:galactarate dehydratase n=1 Tax=Hydrogenophaga sp. 5NK40-0174 TaxID=3127649 RepID=UPI0031035249